MTGGMGARQDLDEIYKLCTNLHLDDSNGLVVKMDGSKYVGKMDQLAECLVGKVLGNKMANWEGLEWVLRSIWKIPNNFKVEQIGSNNIFLFQFGSVVDKHWVMAGGP